MGKFRPEATKSEARKMSSQITPLVFCPTRKSDNSTAQPTGGVAGKLDINANPE
jgi:hypothetical protein